MYIWSHIDVAIDGVDIIIMLLYYKQVKISNKHVPFNRPRIQKKTRDANTADDTDTENVTNDFQETINNTN